MASIEVNEWSFDPPNSPGWYWVLEHRRAGGWSPRVVQVVERVWNGAWTPFYERRRLRSKVDVIEWVRVRRRPRAILWGPVASIPPGIPDAFKIRTPVSRGRYLLVGSGKTGNLI